MTKDEIQEQNGVIARYLGYKHYPVCRTPTWFYECENYKWEDLDEDDVWVLEPTEEFDKTPCTSETYWEYERDLPKQWKDYDTYLTYDSSWNELIPVTKQVLEELWNAQIPHPDQSYNNLKNAINTLEIDKVWECTVQAIITLNNSK